MDEDRDDRGGKIADVIGRAAELKEKLAMAEVELNHLVQEIRIDWERRVQETVPEAVREQVWQAYAREHGLPLLANRLSQREAAKPRQIGVDSTQTRNHAALPRPTSRTERARAARLDELVKEGFLSNGQMLYFRPDDGRSCPGPRYQARITGNRLIHLETQNLFSMSRLARELNQDFGRQDAETRGPMYWYTEKGRSILQLWAEYTETDDA